MAKKDRCWPGYEPVKGKQASEQGSCRPKTEWKETPKEKEFRAERKQQLDEWQAEHPGKPRSAAQHLKAPVKKKATKSASATTARKKKTKTAAKRSK